MRLDIYTSSDRASALRNMWLEQEAGKYFCWAIFGAILISYIFVSIVMVLAPADYLFSGAFNSHGFYRETNPYVEVLVNLASPISERIYASLLLALLGPLLMSLGAVKLTFIWLIVFGISLLLCRFFVQIIAVSQGVVFGAIAYGVTWGLLSIIIFTFEIPWTSISIIVGGIVGFLGFVGGVLGAYLPAAR